jgi:hypothetical protein
MPLPPRVTVAPDTVSTETRSACSRRQRPVETSRSPRPCTSAKRNRVQTVVRAYERPESSGPGRVKTDGYNIAIRSSVAEYEAMKARRLARSARQSPLPPPGSISSVAA